MRYFGFRHVSAILLLLGCSQAAGAGSYFAQVSSDVFAAADERVELPSAQLASLYQEVLKHYRPAGNRMRLLNPALLPSAAGQESGGTMQPVVAKEIVANLGDHFCAMESERTCNGRNSGGELRVSPVYYQADNRVRVAVRYSSMEPYGPEQVSTQVFLLEQAKGKWVIRARR
jgi:hypothetical protein